MAVLTVRGGRLDGAQLPLEPGRRVVVGSSLDCDVVLRDPSIAARALVLVALARPDDAETDAPWPLQIEVLEGSVELDSETLSAGDSVRAKSPSFQLGDLTLHVGAASSQVLDAEMSRSNNDSQAIVQMRSDVDAAADSEAAFDATTDSAVVSSSKPDTDSATSDTSQAEELASATADSASVEPVSTRSRFLRPVPLAAAAVLLVAAVLAGIRLVPFAPESSSSHSPSIATLLKDSKLEHVAVQRRDGRWILEGRVQNRQEELALSALIEASRETPIVNRTEVVSETLARVVDVFRVNGVNAEAEYGEDDTIRVRTTTRDVDKLAKLESIVKADVPSVRRLEIDNTRPASRVGSGDQDDDAPVAGKRVAMVVADSPAYVVTEDQSHYFVGALLPSGHRIQSIDAGRVTLSKDGHVTELEF